jgi:hypothetical protein
MGKKVISIVLALALAGVGVFQMVHGFEQCNGKRELHWSSQRAATIESGDFAIKIPAGWRDASESTDDEMKQLLAKEPGAHVMVRENFDGAMIMVKSGPAPDVGAKPPCDDLAAELAKVEGTTTSNNHQQAFDNDPGCAWTARKGDFEMNYNVRFHGPMLLLVACSKDGGACQQALAGISLKK